MALVILADKFVRAWAILLVMPLSFTVAYAFTVLPPDQTGLAGVGVIMVAVGTFLGTLAVVGAVRGIRRIRILRGRGGHRAEDVE
ncbi:hypothetical protein GCM10023354_23860 [Garicola koreensis]